MKDKKVIIGISLVIILLIISIFISPKETSQEEKTPQSNPNMSEDANTILANAQNESTSVKESEKKDFISINVDKYLEYYNGPDKQIVLIGRPTCHYCEIAEPILHNIAFEYNLNINYLNIDEFSEDDTTNFYHSDETFDEGFGTPMLLIIGDNKIQDKIDGLTDRSHYIEFLKLNEYIR